MSRFPLYLSVFGALGIFLVDRLAKSCFFLMPTKQFSSALISLKLYKNTGIAFSVPVPQIIIIILTIALSLYIIHALINSLQTRQIKLAIGQIFIIIGASSNLIDRLKWSFVVDYIQLIFYWWIFNLADVLIVAGIILWVYCDYYQTKKPQNLTPTN